MLNEPEPHVAACARQAPTAGMPAARATWLGWILALCVVVASTVARVEIARADRNFAETPVEGLLRSDPGLAYYVTQRIVEAHGGMPADFRADPRIEHPMLVDVPSLMPVGVEFLVAWTHLALGGDRLVDTCAWVSSTLASLVLLGIFGLALELTRRLGLSLLALVAAATMLANYRTLGFLLMDEDLALPLFALHLWLAARAWRVRTASSMTLAGLTLAAALASWHALTFCATLEALVVLAWFARTSRHPFESSRSLGFVLCLVAFCVLVPMLTATGALFSFPILAAIGLAGASMIARARGGAGHLSRGVGLGAVAAFVLASFALRGVIDTGQENHAHVFDLLMSKLAHLGQLPADPRELSFDVRLMWQGPFATLDPAWGVAQLTWPLLALAGLLPELVRALRRPPEDPRPPLVALFALLSLPVAWLVMRTIVLPGMLLPPLVAWIARGPRWRAWTSLAVLGLQVVQFTNSARHLEVSWYRPVERQLDLARMVRALPDLVPEGAAVAADFMTGTAILSHTGRPILFQPKWESAASRKRVHDLLLAFHTRTPAELRVLLQDEYDCHFLVVDRQTLGSATRYAAGITARSGAPMAGTAAEVLLSTDESVLRGIPGYRLLYRSPLEVRTTTGDRPADFFRVYQLAH